MLYVACQFCFVFVVWSDCVANSFLSHCVASFTDSVLQLQRYDDCVLYICFWVIMLQAVLMVSRDYEDSVMTIMFQIGSYYKLY